jgi:hypothetical protein
MSRHLVRCAIAYVAILEEFDRILDAPDTLWDLVKTQRPADEAVEVFARQPTHPMED